jgi:D-alanyl-D-alanine dipeptidase
MKFTYLDLIDPSISFVPIMATNWFPHQENAFYSLFTHDETEKCSIPGYEGNRCIIELEMAKRLSLIQGKLAPQGLSLRVYDAYRPQKAVDFFTNWTQIDDTPTAKSKHYPRTEKRDFHALSYLSQTSSHALGTAVDVTIISKTPQNRERPSEFLGIWDPESLDVGNVGYLAFDERSWHSYPYITSEQRENRSLLYSLMKDHEFEYLEEEFWHYYFCPDRNKKAYFNFDIRDDYTTNKDLIIERIYGFD